MDRLTFSVVIPCHNEADNIGGVLADLQSLRDRRGPLEVVVVDDGSTDGTADVVAHYSGVACLRLPSNQGKGRALVHGIRRTRGAYVVLMDGDGQDPPDEIPKLLDAVEAGADFVIGSKFLGRIEPGALTGVNYLGNRALTWLLNTLYATQLTDTQSGFRCVRADFLRTTEFRSQTYDIESEMLIRALNAHLVVREVPVRRAARGHGSSGLKSWPHGWKILRTILRERWSR